MKPTNQLKRFFSALLVILVVLSAMPTAASAVAPAVVTVVSDKTSNPLFDSGGIGEVWGDAAADQLLSDISGGAVGPVQENYLVEVEDVLDAIAAGMENRKGTISIGWQIARTKISTNAELKALLKTAFYAAMEHTGVPTRGDYLAWTWNNMQYTCTPYYCGGDYLLDITYRVTYYTSASQEKKLSEEIDDIIDDFDLPASADPYTIVEEVYDYICDEVEYDHSNDGSMLKYTAYAAVMKGEAVCQGYATLLYRMLLELGIDCRVITGDTNGDGYSDHAWNIVKLGQSYYNADSTWDAGRSRYNYFLRCPSNFSGHTRDDSYTTSEFHADYPMAKKDYSKTATPLSIVTQPKSVTVGNSVTASATVVAKGDGLSYQWYIKNKGDKVFSASSIKTATYSAAMDATRDGRQVYCVITDKYGNKLQTNTVTLTMLKPEITAQPGNVKVALNETFTVSFTAKGEGLKYEWYYKDAGAAKFLKTSTFTGPEYTTQMTDARAGRQVYCVVTDKYGASVKTDTVTFSVDSKVVITRQPESVKGKLGETVIVNFAAEGTGLTYEWYYKEASAAKFLKTSTFTGPEYTVQMTEARADRQIYCVITDKYGATAQTQTVALQLDAELVITRQPESVTAAKDQTAVVNFNASGLGLTYEWYFANAGSDNFVKTDTFSGPEYTAQMNESRDGRRIYCVVTDKFGASVQTETVTLSMYPLPKITQQPESVKAKMGETVTVSFTAEGEELTYEWYYKEAGAAKFIKTSTFTGPEYTAQMSEARAGRQIYCVVTDKYGVKVQTETITLMPDSEVIITRQPESVTVAKNQDAVVSFTAEGLGLTYEWYFANAGSDNFVKTDTFSGPEYTAQMNESRDGRQIYCIITDKYGVKVQTETVTLSMIPLPKITQQPENVMVAMNESFTVSFVAEGEELTYEWYYKEAGAAKFLKTSTFTGPEYTTQMTAARAGRQIYCVVTDKYGFSVQTNTVTLNMA